MALRTYRSEFLHSHNKGLTLIQGQFTVDSTQTSDTTNYKVSAIKGTGISKILNIATGVYQITLTDKYFKFLNFHAVTASINTTQVAIASCSNGVPYVIKTLGTSAQADWVLAGMDSNVTAAVGVAFTAVTAASGATGTGYAAPQITDNITKIQVYGVPDTTINPQPAGTPYFYIQTLQASSDTLAAAAPTDGTIVYFDVLLRNSNMVGTGE